MASASCRPSSPAIAELRRRGVNLRVVTDNLGVAKAIAAAAASGDTFSVFIEIDSGAGRAGLPFPALPGLLDIARVLHEAPGVDLAGVMTHAGHSYHESTADGLAAVAEQERRAIVGAAEALRAAGIPCPIVSGGSTPTAMHSRDFTGITEMRPGVYVFNDLDQEFIGSCGAGDLALSVLASVIGHYPHRNQLLVDAGALALSKDISAQEFQPKVGFGTIADRSAAGLAVVECSQEHGFVAVGRSPALRRPAGRVAGPHPAQSRLHHRRGLRPLLRRRQRSRRRQVGGRRLRPHQRLVIATAN